MQNLTIAKMIDIPPVWLVGMCVLAWLQSQHLSFGLSIESWFTDLLSGLLIGAGLILMLLSGLILGWDAVLALPIIPVF